MVSHPQMPHTHGVGRADPERHHHHGEHGRSWPLDRKTAPLFPRDISRVLGAPSTPLATRSSTLSKKRKRCQSPPPEQLSKPTSNAEGPRPPKHRVAVAERKPLADTQQRAIVEQDPLLSTASRTSLKSPDYNPNIPYYPVYTPPLPPSFVAAHSSLTTTAYATAMSFRQCVQQYADRYYLTVRTNYYSAGPGHAQLWCAQITITRRLRSGQEVTVISHTGTQWYSSQADAKEAASAEVWAMLQGRR